MPPGGAEALVKFAEMTKEARIVDLVVRAIARRCCTIASFHIRLVS
jgi:hypothetical protein